MNITITTPYIKLDQLLKFSGLCGDGVHAKFVISEGEVSVNGEVERRRGRKLYPGDVVDFGEKIEVDGGSQE